MQNDTPDWLCKFAIDVSELIRKYNAEAQFKDAIREWIKTFDLREYLIPLRREYRPSLVEMYVLLVAIRDHVHHAVQPFGPDSWQTPLWEDMEENLALTIYTTASGNVPELTEADLPCLKVFLADVEADLKANETEKAQTERNLALLNFSTWYYCPQELMLPQWEKDLCWQVDSLIRDNGAMPRFRDMVRAWAGRPGSRA